MPLTEGARSSIGGVVGLGLTAAQTSSVTENLLIAESADSIAGCLSSSWATKKVMHAGDSLVTGSNAAPGGSRIVFLQRARMFGSNIKLWGPVIANLAGFPVPYTPRCAGYPGSTLGQALTMFSTGGVINAYLAANGNPDLCFIRWGSGDVSTGQTFQQIVVSATSLFAQIGQVMPNARKVVETIPFFYTPAAPVGGLTAANAIAAQYNAWLLATVPTLGDAWSVIDSAGSLTQAQAFTDGAHLTASGQATIGAAEFAEYQRIFPLSYGTPMPRPFVMRTKQASAKLTNKAADQILFTADNGWRLPASNFLLFWRWNPTDLTNVSTTSILQSTPTAQNYSKGFLSCVRLDGAHANGQRVPRIPRRHRVPDSGGRCRRIAVLDGGAWGLPERSGVRLDGYSGVHHRAHGTMDRVVCWRHAR